MKDKVFSDLLCLWQLRKEKPLLFTVELVGWVALLGLFAVCPIFTGRIGSNLMPILMTVIMGVVLFIYSFLKKKIVLTPFILGWVIFAFYALILTALTTKYFVETRTMVLIMGMSIVAHEFIVISGKKHLGFICFSFAMCLFGFFYCFIYRNELLSFEFDRLGAFFEDQNMVGVWLFIGSASTSTLAVEYKGWWYLSFIPSCVFCILALTTGSRAAILYIFLELIIILYCLIGRKKMSLYALCIAFGIVIFVSLINLPVFSSLKERVMEAVNILFGFQTDYIDRSTTRRASMMMDGLQLFAKNFFFGLGGDGFRVTTRYGTNAHAAGVNILCNYGILGGLLYYLPIIYSFRRTKGDKYFFSGPLIALIPILVVGSFFVMYSIDKVFTLFCGVCAAYTFIGREQDDLLLEIDWEYKPFVITASTHKNRLVLGERK